jgi:hypothetical protein
MVVVVVVFVQMREDHTQSQSRRMCAAVAESLVDTKSASVAGTNLGGADAAVGGTSAPLLGEDAEQREVATRSITVKDAVQRIQKAWLAAAVDPKMSLLSKSGGFVTLSIPLGSLGRSKIDIFDVNPKHFGSKPVMFVQHLRDVQRHMQANEPWNLQYSCGCTIHITSEGVRNHFVSANDRWMGNVVDEVSATIDMPLAPGTQEGLLKVIKVALAALEPVPGIQF